MYDINFTNISKNEEVNFTITHKSMKIKTEFYGLSKNTKNARENGFIYNEILKLTKKNLY